MHLPISLELFAKLRARLDEGDNLDELLAAEGLSIAVWEQGQRGWLTRMGDEAIRKRHVITPRYQQLYLAERPALFAKPPRAAVAAVINETEIGLNIDYGCAVPFLAGPVEDRASIEGASESNDEPTAAALEASSGETQFMPALLDSELMSDGEVLPFSSSSTHDAPPAESEPAPPSAAAPHYNRVVEPPVVTMPVAAPQPVQQATRPASSGVDETVMAGEVFLDLGAALPFDGESVMPGSVVDELAPVSASDLDGTAIGQSAVVVEEALPFGAAADEPVVLSCEQYASLSAELAVFPDRAEATLARYGIHNAAQHQCLLEQWRQRLARDPAEAAAFGEQRQRFEQWLRQQQG